MAKKKTNIPTLASFMRVMMDLDGEPELYFGRSATPGRVVIRFEVKAGEHSEFMSRIESIKFEERP